MNQVKEFDKTETGLTILEERYTNVPDVTTKEGYEVCRAGLAELRTTRTTLAKMRLNLNKDDQERIRFRNSEAKRITIRITALEDPMKAAKKKVDDELERIKREAAEAEQRRIDDIQERVSSIHLVGQNSYTAAELQASIDELELIVSTDGFDEFADSAELAKNNAVEKLAGRLASAKDAEKTAMEAETQRVAQEAEAKKQAEERAELDRQRKEIADAKAAQEAEAQALKDKAAAIEKAESDRREAEAQAIRDKEAAIQAEEQAKADKIAAEKAEKAEKAKALIDAKNQKERFDDDSKELERIADMLHDIMRNEPLNGLVTDDADRVFDDVRGHLANAINTIRLSNVVMSQQEE